MSSDEEIVQLRALVLAQQTRINLLEDIEIVNKSLIKTIVNNGHFGLIIGIMNDDEVVMDNVAEIGKIKTLLLDKNGNYYNDVSTIKYSKSNTDLDFQMLFNSNQNHKVDFTINNIRLGYITGRDGDYWLLIPNFHTIDGLNELLKVGLKLLHQKRLDSLTINMFDHIIKYLKLNNSYSEK
jgi:hypothetical protein